MTGTGFGLLTAMAAITAFLIWQCWRQDTEIARLRSRHARPRARDDAAAARPATTLVTPADGTPVWHEETPAAALANAMWKTSEPFLPELPPGRHAQALPRYSNGRADMPVVRVETGGHPPWTGEQPAVDETQDMRREYIAARFREREEAGLHITTGFMRETVALSRELPPVYGEVPVADVIEAERLNQVMTQ